MSTHSYNDGLRSGGRRPRLYLARGGEVCKFDGRNLPGYCAVVTAQYHKNGKWSSTAYALDLAAGVRPLEFLSPLHGTWGDDLASWGEVAERLCLPVEVAQAVVRAEYPRTGERLDQLEAFAVAAEVQGEAAETVIVSFGAPTCRASRDGYWSQPKSAQASDGTTVTIRPGGLGVDQARTQAEAWGQRCGHAADAPEVARFLAELLTRVGWDNPEVVAPKGAKVLAARHKPGMHGGYWTIEVVVPVRPIPSGDPT